MAIAQEPTIEQLLATPTAAEIVGQWKAVCLDHAGDPITQEATVKSTGLTWPYQAYFHPRGGEVDCVVASATKPGTVTGDFLGPLSTATALPAGEFRADKRGLSADLPLNGRTYRVGASTSDMGGGNLVTTVILAAK